MVCVWYSHFNLGKILNFWVWRFSFFEVSQFWNFPINNFKTHYSHYFTTADRILSIHPIFHIFFQNFFISVDEKFHIFHNIFSCFLISLHVIHTRKEILHLFTLQPQTQKKTYSIWLLSTFFLFLKSDNQNYSPSNLVDAFRETDNVWHLWLESESCRGSKKVFHRNINVFISDAACIVTIIECFTLTDNDGCVVIISNSIRDVLKGTRENFRMWEEQENL